MVKVAFSSHQLLDALDHFCTQVESDPDFAKAFYATTTQEGMVAMAVATGILIDANDFRALLRSGSTEAWLLRGDDTNNPIAHLQTVFGVRD